MLRLFSTSGKKKKKIKVQKAAMVQISMSKEWVDKKGN